MLRSTRKMLARATPFCIRTLVPLKISKHLYFNGTFHARMYGRRIATLRSDGYQIENEIYWKGFEGCHEGLSTQIWVSLIKQVKPVDVWDIGANSGTYGILAKSIWPECSVSFFDPIPKAVEIINENLELNQFEANVFEVALGDFDGTGSIFFPAAKDFETSVTVNRDMTPSHIPTSEILIQVLRAETLIDSCGLRPPQLIKLDVETFEVEVIKGFGRHLPSYGIFLIEILSHQNASALHKYFQKENYSFYNIDDSAGTFRETDGLEKSDFYNYLIIPKTTLINFDDFKNSGVLVN
jgi:FkbM family methyltransferase